MPVINNPYDTDAKAHERTNQEDPWVMYLIVRESLGMSPGKMCAQVGHVVDMMRCAFETDETLHVKKLDAFFDWTEESFRKVVLKADDKEWEKVKLEHECYVVKDAGLTQVDPGSETVIGLWPMKKSSRSKLLKRLQVLP